MITKQEQSDLDELTGLRAALAAKDTEIARLTGDNLCDVCGNASLSSGAACVCGGTGRMSDAAIGLRRLLLDADDLLTAERQKVRTLRDVLKHRMPVGWCLAERLRLGHDIVVSETPAMIVVETVGGLHAGTFSSWLPDGSNLIRCGTRHWAEFGTVELTKARVELARLTAELEILQIAYDTLSAELDAIGLTGEGPR